MGFGRRSRGKNEPATNPTNIRYKKRGPQVSVVQKAIKDNIRFIKKEMHMPFSKKMLPKSIFLGKKIAEPVKRRIRMTSKITNPRFRNLSAISSVAKYRNSFMGLTK
jgi:hypothetical protein